MAGSIYVVRVGRGDEMYYVACDDPMEAAQMAAARIKELTGVRLEPYVADAQDAWAMVLADGEPTSVAGYVYRLPTQCSRDIRPAQPILYVGFKPEPKGTPDE